MCIIYCGPTCECILIFLFQFFNWLNAKKWETCQEALAAETEKKNEQREIKNQLWRFIVAQKKERGQS